MPKYNDFELDVQKVTIDEDLDIKLYRRITAKHCPPPTTKCHIS